MEDLKYLHDDERKMLERAENATTGVWRAKRTDDESHEPIVTIGTDIAAGCIAAGILTENGEADAAFIAHSRTDVPELLRRLNEARRELAEQRCPTISISGGPRPTPSSEGEALDLNKDARGI
jgi:DNA-binding LacI/PurR family transcriptional regulator